MGPVKAATRFQDQIGVYSILVAVETTIERKSHSLRHCLDRISRSRPVKGGPATNRSIVRSSSPPNCRVRDPNTTT
jgi:hypothetical protein